MKKTNMYLEAMNGFIDAFELERDKIGTKIKDNNGTNSCTVDLNSIIWKKWLWKS